MAGGSQCYGALLPHIVKKIEKMWIKNSKDLKGALLCTLRYHVYIYYNNLTLFQIVSDWHLNSKSH